MTDTTLKHLAAQLVRSNLRNPEAQELIHHRLLGARDRIAAIDKNLSGCLDAAAVLTRSICKIDDGAAEELQKMVVRLVKLVSETCERLDQPEGSSEDGAQLSPAPPEEGLQTLNELTIGGVLVQLGLVTEQQVDAALQVSMGTSDRLGDVLVKQGLVSRVDVERAQGLRMAMSQTKPTEPAEKEPATDLGPVQAILFGEILLRSGKIDQEQLDRALALKAENGARMGEALVETGAISWQDVSQAVHIQESLGGSSERGSDVTIVELD
jgi:hypothetical protein